MSEPYSPDAVDRMWERWADHLPAEYRVTKRTEIAGGSVLDVDMTPTEVRPGSALYDIERAGRLHGSVLVDREGVRAGFTRSGQLVLEPPEPWVEAVAAWRKVNKGIWP